MQLTAYELFAIVPGMSVGALEKYLPFLNTYMNDPRYMINTPQRAGAFIAQVAHESINFTDVTENTKGLEYEFSTSLGNTQKGDGPKYIGRGLIQITGKRNYQSCSLHIFNDGRLLGSPTTLTIPQYAVQSACWYWKDRSINDVCDQPEGYVHPGEHHYGKYQWITVKVNGGLNGYDNRLALYNRARAVLNF